MDHIGDTLIRKAIQQAVARIELKIISVARYDLNGYRLWVAIGRRPGVEGALEEVVFTEGSALTCIRHDPTYRTTEHLPEED